MTTSIYLPVTIANGLDEQFTVTACVHLNSGYAGYVVEPQVCIDSAGLPVPSNKLPASFWIDIEKYVMSNLP